MKKLQRLKTAHRLDTCANGELMMDCGKRIQLLRESVGIETLKAPNITKNVPAMTCNLLVAGFIVVAILGLAAALGPTSPLRQSKTAFAPWQSPGTSLSTRDSGPLLRLEMRDRSIEIKPRRNLFGFRPERSPSRQGCLH